jgi:hypothetical protein
MRTSKPNKPALRTLDNTSLESVHGGAWGQVLIGPLVAAGVIAAGWGPGQSSPPSYGVDRGGYSQGGYSLPTGFAAQRRW